MALGNWFFESPLVTLKKKNHFDNRQFLVLPNIRNTFVSVICSVTVCVCVCVLVAQSCLTLCNSMDCSPPGSSVHGILQARTLEWVAIPFSREPSQPRDQTQVSYSVITFI